MVRGERDYTQRVLATIRPMGVVGGGILRFEDFEQLVPKDPSPGSTFSITTTQGEVWDGDGAGKYTLTPGILGYYTLSFPQPTPTIVAGEVIFRRISGRMNYVNIRLDSIFGGVQYIPVVQVYDDGSNLQFQYSDDTATMATAKTLGASPIDTNWHLLYFRVNMELGTYEFIQYDAERIVLTGKMFTTGSSTAQPYSTLTLYCYPKTTNSLVLAFDNLILAYEDI